MRDTFYRERQLWSENECQNSVRERQLCSGDVGFVTLRSLSYVLFYVKVSGVLSSFNYMQAEGLQLSNQDYTICIRYQVF